MTRSSRFFGTAPLLLALFLPRPAGAEFLVQDEFGTGVRGLTINNAAVLAQIHRDFGLGLEHAVYSLDSLPQSVNAFRARLSYATNDGAWGLRPVLYPKTMGSGSSGAAVFHNFIIPGDDDDTHSQAGLSLGAMRHDVPFVGYDGRASQHVLGQYFGEAQFIQSYFDIFQFGFMADVFMYDLPMNGVASTGSLFHIGDVTGIGGIRPMTKFPRFAGTVQFVRRIDAGMETHFFANYSYIGYAGDFGFAHSVLLGMDFRLNGRLSIDVSEHLLREQGDGLLGTTGIMARVTF